DDEQKSGGHGDTDETRRSGARGSRYRFAHSGRCGWPNGQRRRQPFRHRANGNGSRSSHLLQPAPTLAAKSSAFGIVPSARGAEDPCQASAGGSLRYVTYRLNLIGLRLSHDGFLIRYEIRRFTDRGATKITHRRVFLETRTTFRTDALRMSHRFTACTVDIAGRTLPRTSQGFLRAFQASSITPLNSFDGLKTGT